MGQFFISLGAAGVAFSLVAFALPQQIIAAPTIPAAIAAATVPDLLAEPVAGMADLHYIEKLQAVQRDLPEQF